MDEASANPSRLTGALPTDPLPCGVQPSLPAGHVALVGAGPGAADLITVRGARLLAACHAVVYDNLVDASLLDCVPATAERIFVGKESGRHCLPQPAINQLLIDLARAGKAVVRLKGGDPFIFGRGGEEQQALVAAGIPCCVVPAVTAALGCAAASGIPLTHRNTSTAVTFITGHEVPDKDGEAATVDWALHARGTTTLVLYMAMGRLAAICEALIAGGRAASTPSAVVQWGTTPRQRVLRAPLGTLPAAVETAAIGSPAIVIIGAVAALGGDTTC
jgi:uroporphyrin-III C-methyltransferase